MPCKKSCEKLWNNYLAKYGDFRERLQLIRDDQQCLMQFQLPRIKQQSLNVRGQLSSTMGKFVVSRNRKLDKKCDPLLSSECCHPSIIKNNRLFPLNKTDLDQLEKLIEAENFPDNIFPVNIETRSSIDNETELSVTNNLHRSTSLLNSIFTKNNINHSITQNDEEVSIHKSMQKSEFVTSSHDPTTILMKNPYAQLLERLRKAEKLKIENSDRKIDDQSFDSTINTNIHLHIQNFLSFLHSLDDTTNNTQNSITLDENTLIALFSINNHLSSSIYVPTNIQQFKIIPKSIYHSLKTTSENEHILKKIQTEISQNKMKEKSYSIDNIQISNFIDQDNELNVKLLDTYTIKAFKDFLIHRSKFVRLPKLFHDLEQCNKK